MEWICGMCTIKTWLENTKKYNVNPDRHHQYFVFLFVDPIFFYLLANCFSKKCQCFFLEISFQSFSTHYTYELFDLRCYFLHCTPDQTNKQTIKQNSM